MGDCGITLVCFVVLHPLFPPPFPLFFFSFVLQFNLLHLLVMLRTQAHENRGPAASDLYIIEAFGECFSDDQLVRIASWV